MYRTTMTRRPARTLSRAALQDADPETKKEAVVFHRIHQSLKIGGTVVAALWAGGCVEYTIDTTLTSDGGGTRRETMEVEGNEEIQVSDTDFLTLMHVSGRDGWEHSVRVEDAGDTVHVFQRVTEVTNMASWADLSGRVRISGATPAHARTSVGYVSLGNVQFRNVVRVGRATLSDGSTSFSYRETFEWSNAFDVIVEFTLADFDRRLASRYPALSERERGEILGFTRARLWAAADQGLFQAGGEDDDRLLAQVVDRTAPQAIKIIRVRYPDAEADAIGSVLGQILDGEEGQMERLFEETVPGLNLAFNTSLQFHLTMPGRVTRSNAEDTNGSVLSWEIEPLDAIAAPVEIYAESVVAR